MKEKKDSWFQDWLENNEIEDKDSQDKTPEVKDNYNPFNEKSFSTRSYPSSIKSRKFYVESEDSLEKWLNKNDVYDKDESVVQKETWRYPPENLHSVRVDATLDLHRLTVDQAIQMLHQFVLQGHRQNDRVLCVIHGKGKHSLGAPRVKLAVIKWLQSQGKSYVRFFKEAPSRYGGSGATLIWLT